MNDIGVARQEAVKREVNEAIEGGLAVVAPDQPMRMRCECGSPDCIAFVSISVPEYERIREHARRFVIANGHQTPSVENVIERTPRYAVVEKFGEAGAVVERRDPRSGPDQSPAL